jgi:replication factor C subunit 3/5
MLYGPPGSGKRSLIKCLLHELFHSNSVHKIKSELKEFKHNSTTVECIVYNSNYHIEVTPGDAEH